MAVLLKESASFRELVVDLSLAEIVACARFADQSQFSHHFKRLVGIKPGQFLRSARIA
jgi:AraC-like DNA-binding protein